MKFKIEEYGDGSYRARYKRWWMLWWGYVGIRGNLEWIGFTIYKYDKKLHAVWAIESYLDSKKAKYLKKKYVVEIKELNQ